MSHETKPPETMQLPVRLTDEERRTRGEELGRLCTRIEADGASASEAAKAARDAIKQLEAERCRLALVVASGEEHRPVEISLRPVLDRGLWEVVRADTGAVVESRVMTADEREGLRQLRLGWSEAERVECEVVARREKAPITVTLTAHPSGRTVVLGGVGGGETVAERRLPLPPLGPEANTSSDDEDPVLRSADDSALPQPEDEAELLCVEDLVEWLDHTGHNREDAAKVLGLGGVKSLRRIMNGDAPMSAAVSATLRREIAAADAAAYEDEGDGDVIAEAGE